jgi:serine/threonine protein kinase
LIVICSWWQQIALVWRSVPAVRLVGAVPVVGVPRGVQYVRVTEAGLLAGRYRLVRSLGRGGFSEVWQAEDRVLGRAVAVKVFTGHAGQPDLVARFHREARTVAGLRHPNVVSVFDAGTDEGVPFVVMELLAGPSLDELLATRGPLPVEVALGYAEQAAAGLAAAHAAGVVHRDIKPANLVLDSDGTLKVVDFGIARLAEASSSLTATGVTFGTPAYLSPEQAAGQPAGPRSDLYALGCVLYALLTGAPPFSGEHPVATAHQHLNAAVRRCMSAGPMSRRSSTSWWLRCWPRTPRIAHRMRRRSGGGWRSCARLPVLPRGPGPSRSRLPGREGRRRPGGAAGRWPQPAAP